jgi:hypothetical protein
LAKKRVNLKMKAPTRKGTREANTMIALMFVATLHLICPNAHAQLVVSSQTISARTSDDRFVVGNLSTQAGTLVVTTFGTPGGVLGLMAPWPGGSAAAGCAAVRPMQKRNAKPSAR